MRIFVYEFISGGGMFAYPGQNPEASLLREGRAMISALARDFARIPGTQVILTSDRRWPLEMNIEPGSAEIHTVRSATHESELMPQLAQGADWTLVLAPEFDGRLLERTKLVEQAKGKLLSPNSQTVQLCSDKTQTIAQWRQLGVPVPPSIHRADVERSLPLVVKPLDGAGSVGIRLLTSVQDWHDHCAKTDLSKFHLEKYCRGTPVSVALLTGSREHVALPACYQWLSDDGAFRYQGGAIITEQELGQRAQALARRAAEIVSGGVGYIGVDLVLGAAPDGSEDVAIELNPRVTTSYIGLSACLQPNLAQLMLDVATGKPIDPPSLSSPLQFSV